MKASSSSPVLVVNFRFLAPTQAPLVYDVFKVIRNKYLTDDDNNIYISNLNFLKLKE